MATSSMQKLIGKFSNSPQLKKALNEVQKVADDLKSKASNLNINVKLPPETKQKIQEALQQYQMLLSRVSETEKQVETEVNKIVSNFRKKQTQVEKNLMLYKKKAYAQKKKLEEIFSKKIASENKKTTNKKSTSKKTSSKKINFKKSWH